MAETRELSSVPSAKITNRTKSSSKHKTETNEDCPHQVLVLPKDICQEARIITLKDPRSFTDSRYLVCPKKGVYEFKDFSGSQRTKRSCFLSPDSNVKVREEELNGPIKSSKTEGYVIQNAKLLIATIIDPLFIILPTLAPMSTKSSESLKNLFLSEDEYFERLVSHSPQFDHFSGLDSIKKKLTERMAAVCDMLEVDGEKMYRLNNYKLLQELVDKAKCMITKGLPPSMEEKLIKRPLGFPTFYQKYKEKLDHNLIQDLDNLQAEPFSDVQKSVSENCTSSNMDTLLSTSRMAMDTCSTYSLDLGSLEKTSVLDRVTDLLRLRTSLFFIISNYIAPNICEIITKLLLTSKSVVDFGPLDSHLSKIAKQREHVLNTRSIDDFSRKRPRLNDEDSDMKFEKGKREIEGKKKPVSGGNGAKALRKVDVSGMKKMSDFFKKK